MMTTSPQADRPISASRWAAGLAVGAIIGVAMVALPLSGHLEGPEAGRWVALGFEQFGNQIDLVGWPAIGFVAALLGMVVAIVAFVGMRDAAFASHRRRALLVDAAGYLVLFATAVSTVTVFAILLSAVPATFLHSLSDVEGQAAIPFDNDVITASTSAAIRLQIGQVLVGFIALGLLGLSRHLDATVRAWDANEADEVASERALLTKRLENRTSLLQSIDATLTGIRPVPTPRRTIITTTACFSAAIAIAATILTTLSLIGWRAANGGDPGNWGGLATGTGVAAAMHTYIVSVTCLAVRTTYVGGTAREDITAGRWHAQRIGICAVAIVATLFTPAALGAVLVTGPHPDIIGTATLMLLLFAVPSAILWLRTGKNSWYEVALVNTARILRSFIYDDTERLRALPDVELTEPASTIGQSTQAMHLPDSQRSWIQLVIHSTVWRVRGTIRSATRRVQRRVEDHGPSGSSVPQ